MLLSCPVFAQDSQGNNREEMQQIMQQMQEMQACVQNLDQSRLQTLQHKTQELEEKLTELCDAGKREQAKQQAIKFSKAFANNSIIQEVKECGEFMQAMVPKILMELTVQDQKQSNNAKIDVCDHLSVMRR